MKGFMKMFTDDQFKSLLIKTLEREDYSNCSEIINDLVNKIKISDVTLDVTEDYTYYQGYKRGWNTLCTYLKIKAPFDDLNFFESHKDLLTETASSLYDKQGNKDRKSTRLNSSHVAISYAVFCLKKKNK